MSNKTTDEQAAETAGAATKPPQRKRGTGFPVVSLSDAAVILKEAGKYGFEHTPQTFASYMGHSTTVSGAFRQRLSAFRDWGLITGSATFTMSEVARMIAVPTSAEAERSAMQEAFRNCDVFLQLYEKTGKETPLNPTKLIGRAVHELGVTPARANKFVDSFVNSACAADLAEQTEQGKVILWDPENPHIASEAPFQAENVPESPDKRGKSSSAPPVIRQTWAVSDGEIIFEVRSDKALPATSFHVIGEVVAQLEALAASLVGENPDGSSDETET